MILSSRFNLKTVPRHLSPLYKCTLPSETLKEATNIIAVVIIDSDLKPSHVGFAKETSDHNLGRLKMRNPKLLTLKVIVGSKYGKPIRALIDSDASCNILAKIYI